MKSTAALLKTPENLLQRDSSTKHFLGVAKGIKRLQQKAFDRLRFSTTTQSKPNDRIFITKIENFNYVL